MWELHKKWFTFNKRRVWWSYENYWIWYGWYRDFTEVKAAYDEVINSIIDFNQDDYGFGPFLVLEGYYAQLGVSDVDDYLENLIAAIKGEELNEPGEIDTYYYLRDGKVKEE